MDPLSIGLGVTSAASGLASGITGLIYGGRQMKLQEQQFEYQKQLNQQLMQREDTAVQRRANDLAAAGISKQMAAGQPAATGSGQSAGPGVGSGGAAMMSSGLQQVGNSIGMGLSAIQSIGDVVNTLKQGKMIDAQTTNTQADTLGKMIASESTSYNLEMARKYKLPTGIPPSVENMMASEFLAEKTVEQKKEDKWYDGIMKALKGAAVASIVGVRNGLGKMFPKKPGKTTINNWNTGPRR